MRKLSYLSRTLSTILSYISHFIILAFSAFLVVEGSFSAGDFFIAVGMIDQLSYPIITISVYLQEIISARPVIKLLLEIEQQQADQKPLNTIDRVEGVRFSDVSFSYEEGPMLLKDISFQLNPLKNA